MKKFILAIIFIILVTFPFLVFGDIITWPLFQAFDDNGDPLNGGLVYTYNCGGVVAKTTYSDAAMTVANANPVVLNARGEADIYAAGCTHLVITTALGVAVEETDNYGEDYITIIEDADGDTQIQVEEAADEDIIRFDIAGTEQIVIDDGSVEPTTDNDIDLGTSTLYFKTVYANVVYGAPPGYLQRAKFRWKDADEIYIGAGRYHHDGTTDQTVYWDSEITFELESAGSNASSDDYGADGWHYIYIDDSAVVTQAAPLLDADCFLNDTTAPSYSASKHGWYNGSDRCIFAVYETGDAILAFWHEGGNYLSYDAPTHDYAEADPADDWSTEVTLTIPAFTSRANCWFLLKYVSANSNGTWRNTDSSDADGVQIGYVTAGATSDSNTCDVLCNSSLKIDIKVTGADPTLRVDTNGWYFPNDM